VNRRRPAALLLLLVAAQAHAAGGHHAVDDAQILDRGECEQENWFHRAQGGERTLHTGASCRVGPFEVGVSGEHARDAGGSQTGWELEAKWARRLAGDVSVGMRVQPAWAAHARPRYQVTSVQALASWTPRVDLALHLNLGRDLVHQGPDTPRHGAAVEWSPRPRWTLLAERYVEEGTQFLRAGARWAGGHSWSLDLSRAQRLAGPTPSNWILGLNFEFGRE
jgi:hypothetical protein